jgi:hypothetical protein
VGGAPAEEAKLYNTGTPEDLRKALEAFAEYNKLLITLATGTVVLSATFLEKFYTGKSLHLLIASWSSLGLSVVLGVITLGESINQLAESRFRIRRGTLEVLSLLQWLSVFAGVGLFAAFVINNVTSSPSTTGRNGSIAAPAAFVWFNRTWGRDDRIAFEHEAFSHGHTRSSLAELYRKHVTVRLVLGIAG